MISEKIEKALNNQINAEMYSSNLYLSMSAYFSSQNLNGFANWMMIQTKEEWAHGVKIYNFLLERGGKVTLEAIEKPKTDWKDAQDVFADIVHHEALVTKLINDVASLSLTEKDHATNNFIQWFIAEQVEEEANVGKIFSEIKLIGNNGYGLLMLDRELATRVFVDPLANPTA